MELPRDKMNDAAQGEIYWRTQFDVANMNERLRVCCACCSDNIIVAFTRWPVRENAAQILETVGTVVLFVDLRVCLKYCNNWRVAQLQIRRKSVLIAAYLDWVV